MPQNSNRLISLLGEPVSLRSPKFFCFFSVYLTVAAIYSAVSPSTPAFLLCEIGIWADVHPHPYSEEEAFEKKNPHPYPSSLYNLQLEGKGNEGEQKGRNDDGSNGGAVGEGRRRQEVRRGVGFLRNCFAQFIFHGVIWMLHEGTYSENVQVVLRPACLSFQTIDIHLLTNWLHQR